MTGTRRVLLAERISDAKGERSESIEGQDEKLRTRASQEADVTIVGTAVDMSVQGDVDMPDRPSLGQWLTPEGLEKWDEIWVTTQDRLSRSDVHFMAFVFKVIEWSKKVTVLDDPQFNEQMHSSEGRLILHAKALGPAKELERIKIRVQDSHDRRRFTSRWHGGFPPFGYRPVNKYVDGKTAAYLELDEEMASVLHEMRRQIIEGQSFLGVAKYLNKEGILTSRDRSRVRKGKPVKSKGGQGIPEQWCETTVRRILTDESTQGLKKHKREVVYGMDGTPVRLAEPIFTPDEWESLQAAVARRVKTTVRRVNGTNPMYGVAFCAACGAKAVHKVFTRGETTYRYYKCGAFPKEVRCLGTTMRAEEVEEWIELHFLQKFGWQRVTKRVWMPGSDTSKEMSEITQRMARLRKQDEEGDWDDDQDGYRHRMNTYKARKKVLESLPVKKAGWVEEDQGMTFLELWPTLDLDGKRKQLIDSGYKVMVGRKTFDFEPKPDTAEEKEARVKAATTTQ
ncbi:recombinase family protein [Streptomyces sp. ISL-100]|uniref:recombinase family protein n=1 Tax=Streptomyces sp. ISL-100 TaxID=2819173 RepID=UPI001BEA1A10|nr:recombinase family protein [Streptomyces sp. ISL-100]MBT2400473.1 recombinase family protein [Streptomyces sp. ISL-100]